MIKLLEKYQILESPGKRKVHATHTPSMGGVAIFLGFVFAILLWWPEYLLAEYRLFIGAVILMFVIGLKDDIIPLKPWQKLVSQFIPITIILFNSNGIIDTLYGFLGVGSLSIWLSVPITFITILVIVNSINLIDGADGLASTICLTSILLLSGWFFLAGSENLVIVSWSFAGAVLGFLIYNWKPAKIFMGDTGALVIGLVLAFLIIQFLNINYSLPEHHTYKLNGISVALCLLFIPLFDTLRVFTIRVVNGKSPFKADKNHIHHIFMRLGYSHSRLTLVLTSINVLFVLISIFSSVFIEEVGLLFVVVFALIFSFITEFLIIKSIANIRGGEKKSVLKLIKSSRSNQSKAS
jgi:UDP-GlcNAc:undecaprenyl-phosphate/decaprenyl-phosphate GlcNAc-1-phosphate transferase